MRSTVHLIFVTFLGLLIRQKALAMLLEPECGITGITDKIMGGSRAVHGANPWMAYLYEHNKGFLCGGSLIHKRFVLTAAHCVENEVFLTVRLGEYYLGSMADSSRVYQVTLAIRNRLHNQPMHANDIAILRLDPEVQFTAFIKPVCIFTDASQAPSVSTYTVTGWGLTENGDLARVLQTLELTEKDPIKCYEHMGVHLGPGQLCAGHPSGDTCVGDSGSPLVHQVNIGGTLRYVQFGLVSYGTRVCVSPGVYTRVPFYADWIVKAVRLGMNRSWYPVPKKNKRVL